MLRLSQMYNLVKIPCVRCDRIRNVSLKYLYAILHLGVQGKPHMKQDLLTPAEAARLKGVSRAAVYAAIAQGRLPCTRVLGRLGLRKADVMTWMPRGYRERSGKKSGPPAGIKMSEKTRARMSEAQKRRWARQKQERG